MTDIASNSINRHNPTYDQCVNKIFGIDQDEALYELAYQVIYVNHPAIARHMAAPKGQGYSYPAQFAEPIQLTINDLTVNQHDIVTARDALLVDDHLMGVLEARRITRDHVIKYDMCKSETLFDLFEYEKAYNLSLAVHRKFFGIIGAGPLHGVSMPYTHNGVFAGFATRVMVEEQARYIKYAFTTPNRMCFGLDKCDKLKPIYIVEGVFDYMAMVDAGHTNCFALGDSQPSAYQLMQAAVYPVINLVLDADYAGYIGMLKAYLFLKQLGSNINIILLPEDRDPSDHVYKYGDLLPEFSLYDELLTRIDGSYDESKFSVSWWDHKIARDVVVDYADRPHTTLSCITIRT